MALTKCAECDREVSTKAGKCPGCGAPMASKSQPAIKVVGVLLLGLVFVVILAGQGKPSRQAAGADGPSPSHEPAPQIETTPAELLRAYSENAVAADARFKGQRLLVTGVVAEISTDFIDQVYILLDAGNPFSNPHAGLVDSERSAAAQLRQGSMVHLSCTGAGDIIKTPMLKDCTFSNEAPAQRSATAVDGNGAVANLAQLSETDLSAGFRCPESYATDDEAKLALARTVGWYAAHHKDATVEDVVAFRVKMLKEHQCAQTLANIEQAQTEAAAQPVPRQATMPEALAGTAKEQVLPSFDCAKARSPVEQLICSDSELGELDSALARHYRDTRARIMAKLPAGALEEFTSESKAAWSRRESECHDAACVVRWYAMREAQLEDWDGRASQ